MKCKICDKEIIFCGHDCACNEFKKDGYCSLTCKELYESDNNEK